jgi:hypothetical protein
MPEAPIQYIDQESSPTPIAPQRNLRVWFIVGVLGLMVILGTVGVIFGVKKFGQIRQEAAKQQEVASCDQEDASARDACLIDLAREKNDHAICRLIQEERLREACIEITVLSKAREVLDEALCLEITREDVRQSCQDEVKREKTRQSCQKDPTAQECADIVAIQKASAAKNPDLCVSVSQEQYLACLDIIGPGDRDMDGLNARDERTHGTSDKNPDSDADGLTDFEEVRTYKTDPTKADTDNDGFSDGDEVKNGYDPNGPGKL